MNLSGSIDISSIMSYIILSVLSLFSIFSFSIIIERLIFFSANTLNLKTYKSFIPDRISEMKKVISEKNKKHPFDIVLTGILRSTVINRTEIRERLDGQFTEIYLFYHKRINMLGIFAKLSTLIGLFGTVTGMISAFNSIVSQGISTASIVAGGISQALFTTAAGLIIAIPATFFYEYFNDKTEKEIRKMEIISSELISHLIDLSRNSGTSR